VQGLLASESGNDAAMMISAEDPRMLPIALRMELIAAGASDRSLARALRAGELARPRRGAYVDGVAWESLTDEQRYAIRARAAYRQASTEVALSHLSAVPFYDGPLWGVPLDDVHLTRLDGRAGRRDAGVCQHGGTLIDGDVEESGDLRITSAIRTALDISMIAPVEPTLCIVNHLLHRGAMTAADLRARYDGHMELWPGSLRTEIVIRLADPRIESVGETRTFFVCWTQHLPRPEPQLEVYDDNGILVARLDFAFPDHGVWLEFDGRIKYEKYLRPGESVTDAVLREKRREELISELTGWRCVRIVWADLANPARLAARIRAAMDSVAAERRRARR
jgi:hypothetical protein